MASSSADTRKRLALAITDFLQASLKDGSVSSEDAESIEVATSCIADAFKVDPSNIAAVAAAAPPGSDLLKIYSAHEATARPASGAAAAGATPSTPAKSAEAEEFKQKGNVAMQRKDFSEAIAMYSKAIELAPSNAIYLSNRAAAYSGSKQHDLAKSDAELAVAADPKYTKGWSRLGLASFALGDARGSMEAYRRGIEAEGNGGSDAMKKGFETARRRVEEDDADDVGSARATSPPRAGGAGGGGGMPDLSALAGMFGGGGGGGGAGGQGGGGGMPDLGALMNNPMLRQMAQNVMSNPDMMSNIMNNPQLRQMADSFGGAGRGGGGGGGSGGGQPDLSAMMNDPSLQEMARNFMGGGGGAGGAGRGR